MTDIEKHLNMFIEKHQSLVAAYKHVLPMAEQWEAKFGCYRHDSRYDGFEVNARDYSNNDFEPGIFVHIWRYNEKRNYAFKMDASVRYTREKKFEYTIEFNRKRVNMPSVLHYKNNDELIAAFEEFLKEDRDKLLKAEKQKISNILNSLPG